MDQGDQDVETGEDHYINGVVIAAEVDVLQGMLNAIQTPELISYEATAEDYQEVSVECHTCDVFSFIAMQVIQETQLLAQNLLKKLRIA